MDIKTCYILGVKVDAVTKKQAAALAESFIASGESHQVCVPNVWCTVLMQKDKQFRQITNQSSLSIPDGMPLTWVSRFYGSHIPERVSGADFFRACAGLAERKGYRFFFMGSGWDVLEAIKKNLNQQYPLLDVVGTYSPPSADKLSEEENQKMLHLINTAKPHFLWVGMTAPKQEKWIWENLHRLKVPVCAGVGAVFDFISGKKRRAPQLMQKAGLEWMYRLYKEPFRLWKRYFIGNFLFVFYVLRDIIKRQI